MSESPSGTARVTGPKISRRARSITPFYAMEFGKRAAELEATGRHIVKLNIGEPDFGAPPAVLAAAREIHDGRPLAYTGALGLPELRTAIADFYSSHFGCEVSADRVVVTAGASAALLLCCAALIDDGDDVLIGDPSYPCNRRFAESFGAHVRLLATGAGQRFQLGAADVEAAWHDDDAPEGPTTGVMIATPSNPTGTSIPPEELAAICALARERGAWRIVDEIYLGLADPGADGRAPHSVLATDPDAIVINSFSKYFGMTGWRLGWCIVPAEMVGVLERLAQNYYICPPTTSQSAALACFTEESLAIAETRRAELAVRRAFVLDALERIGLPVPVPPDGAFYIYIDVSGTGLDAGEFCDRALAEAGVALTPGKDFGDIDADKHVRLSYAAAVDELAEGMSRLHSFVDNLRAAP